MSNPLLKIKNASIPTFKKVEPKHIESTIKQLLKENRLQLKKLLRQKKYTWENLMTPLEESSDQLHKTWGIVSHLNNVVNSKPLRKIYNSCLPKLSAYFSEISHNKKLYHAIQYIANSKEYRHLDIAQKKIINDDLRDFKLSGVTLSPNKKKLFAKLQRQQTELGAKFSENVLDATQSWTKLITEKSQLSGLPEYAINAAKELATQHKSEGWMFTLEFPSYLAIMMYADSSMLRQEFYTAYTTRASDQGSNAHRFDNSKIIERILTIRLQLGKLLNFKNFAEYALTTRMAKKPKMVISFLNKLAKYAKPKALQELKELAIFAKKKYGIDNLSPWDVGYYSEKLIQEKFSISQEMLRPYFPELQVLDGLFALINRLYGIKIKPANTDVWHQDVKFFNLYDAKNMLQGSLYIDLYARPNKRGGAWMDSFCSRRKCSDNSIQLPVAYVICNFSRPLDKKPALFTHDEVNTLFHEFGHALQHLLTKIDYSGVSGINGIPSDAIEIASQFMENWCWEKPVLKKIAKHYKTGKPLPNKLFSNMLKAKNFQSGMQTMRQLEFALFDMRLHVEFSPKNKNHVEKILEDVRKTTATIPVPKFNRFQNGFTHVFADGSSYAAGYYSYKWSEVLSSDAFAKFLEDGIFNKKTSAAFLHNILEPGGSVEPMTLFKRFRGRAPKIDALLKQDGILSRIK